MAKAKTIREILGGKPSAALFAMRDGLRRLGAKKTKGFVIDMGSFGHTSELDEYEDEDIKKKAVKNKVCFGCAATCTIDEVLGAGKWIQSIFRTGDAGEARAARGSRRTDFRLFESVMDDARQGDLRPLFQYMGVIESYDEDEHDYKFNLNDDDWREQLPAVTKLARSLAKKGL